MSDLIAFIRQWLPPQWRGPKTIGLVTILFSPILYLITKVQKQGADALARAYANGQVAVLEATLSQALNAPVYILEGDRSSVDFQVIVPLGTSANDMARLKLLLTRYALGGKRWRLSEAPSYAPGTEVFVLGWSVGFPIRTSTQLKWAVTRAGNYPTRITKNGVVVFDEVMSYQAGVEQTYAATVASDVYKLEVDSLSYTLAGTGIIEMWAVRNGADNLSLYIDANPGNAYTWIVDTLASNGSVQSTSNGGFEYSPSGYSLPSISPTRFHYGGLVLVVNGTFRLRVSGGTSGGSSSLLFDQNFTISDAQTAVNFVLGPVVDNSGTIDAITVQDFDPNYALVKASGPGANNGVQGRLTGPDNLDTGWRNMASSPVTVSGVSYTHLTALSAYIAGVDGTFTFQARLTQNASVVGSYTFTQGTPVVGFGPTMNLIRFRYRASENLCDVGITAPGEWEYQVARPDLFTDEGRQYQQQPPNWNAIAWTDFPGSGNGERVLSSASRTNFTVLFRVRNKSNIREMYEIPVKCQGGSYGWLRLAEPTAGTVNMSAVSFLPYRTWTEDLTITTEAHPTDNRLINLRVKSGFSLAANTHWYWWVGLVPLFGKQDQDDFLYPVTKGMYIEVYRYVCPYSAYIYYDDQHPDDGGQTIASFQWTASKYSNGNILHTDQVRLYIPKN